MKQVRRNLIITGSILTILAFIAALTGFYTLMAFLLVPSFILLCLLIGTTWRYRTNLGPVQEPSIDKERAQRIKRAFKQYFDGASAVGDVLIDRVEADTTITTERLRITNIEIYDRDGDVVLEITLERPGILIGRAGSRIDALGEYIRKQCDEPHLVIRIEESNIWK